MAATPATRRQSLGRELTWRLLYVFLIVSLVGNVVIFAGYRYLTGLAHREIGDNAQAYVAENFKQLQREWERNATEVRTQIDFMRIFAQDQKSSWLSLQAFFASMEGRVGKFPSGIVLQKNGQIAIQFGPGSAEFARAFMKKPVATGWFYAEQQRSLYALIQTELWQGTEGSGKLIFMQPVDVSTLSAIAGVDTHLFLVLNGTVVASNDGVAENGKAMPTGSKGRVQQPSGMREQRSLPLFGDGPQDPMLVIQQGVKEPVSLYVVLASSLTLLAALTGIFWFVVGRFAQRTARRLGALSRATALFSQEHAISQPLQLALAKADSRHDEIGDFAVSFRRLMEGVIRHDQEHFGYMQTLDILEEGVVELSTSGQYLHASPGWHRLSGTDATAEQTIFDVLHQDDRPGFQTMFAQLVAGDKASLHGRIRLLHGAAAELWVDYRFIPGALDGTTVRSVRGVLRDITQGYLLQKHVTHLALHDALTGLPNRVLLEDRCKVALRMAERNGRKAAIGFMDLDNFKHVNDQFGHKVGDQLLQALANGLRGCIRSGDTLARWGGDEFVVLLADVSGPDGAKEAISKLVEVCNQAVDIDGVLFNTTFSMGVALYPDDAATVETLLSHADRAMFGAKEQGRNNVRFFTELLNDEADKRAFYIQNKLAVAIKEHRLQAWFQPIVDAQTGAVLGCEALARWNDDTYGWVSPATFIPMAEELGLIRELGDQIWSQSIVALNQWRAAGSDIRIAVNVSRRQLFTPTFVDDLLDDLQLHNIPIAAVDLEVTESVATEKAGLTVIRLQELGKLGFGISIDDFGTGYSSLSQLHEMPATKVKIDISFVRRVHTEQGAQLIKAIVNIAAAFGLKTVAEGVESAEVANTLRHFGVDMLQGYHFGKPMTGQDFTAFLRPVAGTA